MPRGRPPATTHRGGNDKPAPGSRACCSIKGISLRLVKTRRTEAIVPRARAITGLFFSGVLHREPAGHLAPSLTWTRSSSGLAVALKGSFGIAAHCCRHLLKSVAWISCRRGVSAKLTAATEAPHEGQEGGSIGASAACNFRVEKLSPATTSWHLVSVTVSQDAELNELIFGVPLQTPTLATC